jgi:uncharacterized protein
MRLRTIATALFLAGGFSALAASAGAQSPESASVDPALEAFITKVRAVDNHTHVLSLAPDDADYDALPIEALFPFPFPTRLMPDSPHWLAGDRALYGYPHADFSEAHLKDLRAAKERVVKEQGGKFPEWALDQAGVEVMLANRVAMGPGLAPPRFRWVSYVDALMLPLSTKTEAASSPDRAKLYPYEEKLLRRYLADLKIAKLPATLDGYLRTVVTPTLERQRKGGCVAVKFEAAYLRPLDFGDASAETASRVYSRYVGGGEPPRAEYKALEDFLFRYIAREVGRLGMAVHVHSLEGAGSFYDARGSDPLLLEPTFNDPTLSSTKFVIVHGGGVYAPQAGAMLWKPNVYLDTSALALIYTPSKLARVLEDWLSLFPGKVLFGTDASAFGPDLGWEVATWVGTTTVRRALGIALTGMMRSGDVSRARAEEIATMVLRTNADKLYDLKLP